MKNFGDFLNGNFSASIVRRSNQKRRIIIGNEEKCQDETNATIPCNGKLKANKDYK
jgi:hypothetical protein